jgi:flavin reductase (DIM6/NTAB) family NADH-FMN oxidoreductase RutF
LPLWNRRFLSKQPFREPIYPDHSRHSGCDLLRRQVAPQHLAYFLEHLSHQERRLPRIDATIVPRPIAWIVTLDREGRVNVAPFSFFNALATDPPTVGIGIGSYESGRPKDTRRNVRETGEFVINLVSEEMVRAMNITAIGFDPGVSELAEAELETRPSIHVKPPRIASAPVAMECKLMRMVELGREAELVLGRVLAMHVREDLVIDTAKHYIDTPKLNLIGRMHAGWYTRTTNLFRLDRISLADWEAREANASPSKDSA